MTRKPSNNRRAAVGAARVAPNTAVMPWAAPLPVPALGALLIVAFYAVAGFSFINLDDPDGFDAMIERVLA